MAKQRKQSSILVSAPSAGIPGQPGWQPVPGVELHRTLQGHQNPVYGVAFDPQSGTLASGGGDNTVRLWEALSGTLLSTLEGHEDWVGSVAFDPRGETLASGSDDKTVKLWDLQSRKLLRTLEGHRDAVNCVAFGPQGITLASGGADNTVKLWEPRSGELFRTLEGHTAPVHHIAFSPDSHLLASKSRDQTIRLWNCQTCKTVAVIPEPTRTSEWIPTLSFHPMLPQLATAGSDPGSPENERSRLIHLWELNLDKLLGTAPTVKTVQHTNAKAPLGRDVGVGNNGPAEGMVHNESVQGTMDAKAGYPRITAEWVIKCKKEQGKYDVFLSHNSKDKAAIQEIAERLLSVGLRPWLDKWDLIPGETIADALERAIDTIPCAAIFFGPGDPGDWQHLEIRSYVEDWAKKKGRFIPVILPDVEGTPEMPRWVRQALWVDLRDWKQDGHDGLLSLGLWHPRPATRRLAAHQLQGERRLGLAATGLSAMRLAELQILGTCSETCS